MIIGRRVEHLLAFVTTVLICSVPLLADVAEMDGPGNLRALRVAGSRLAVSTDVWLPAKGWGATARTRDVWNVSNVVSFEADGKQVWTGRAAVPGGPVFDYRQSVSEASGKIHWAVTVTSRTNADLEGAFLFIRVPVATFKEGLFSFLNGDTLVRKIRLPDEYPGQPHLSSASANDVEVRDQAEQYRLGFHFDRSRSVTIQDNREWGEPYFAIYYAFHSGNLASGNSVSTAITIDATGKVETGPVQVTLGEASENERFDGWGGNFVFCNTGPEVQYLLSELRVSWARSGMSLREWEPQNDNTSPDSINWSYFESRVRPGSQLDKEFRAAKELEEQGIPHIVSVWWLPTWLQPMEGTALPQSKWGELKEMVGSYLLFAKEHYGVEPDLFSFNEPDLGVYVLFSESDHAALIKSFGSYFAALGLKTKLLLGDVANASNPSYVDTGAVDSEALKYVSAVAFHSWNGAQRELLDQWRVKAREMDLPLLVTEVGSDPSAWHYPTLFATYGYALDDLQNYMEFLSFSRPQAALQWELTCDYPLVTVQQGSVTTSKRYFFVKHLANLTPAAARYVDASSSDSRVWTVAFLGQPNEAVSSGVEPEPMTEAGGETSSLVIHVANLGPGRTATISGLPTDAVVVRGVRTSESEEFVEIGRFPVANGEAVVELGDQSLTTLVAEMGGNEELHFAHFAKGLDLLSSRVTLVNPSSQQRVTGRIELANDEGEAVRTELNGVAVTGQAGFSVPTGGSAILETNRGGELVTGSARIVSDGPVDGTLLFGGPVGVAGVGRSEVINGDLITPVEMSRVRGIKSGVALSATGNLGALLQAELRDQAGKLLATAAESIPGRGHLAKFVDEFSWEGQRPADEFLGTLVIRSTAAVAATVLQTRSGEFVTLPVTPVVLDGAGVKGVPRSNGPGTTLLFPHFAKGEELLESELILVNPDPAVSADVSVVFRAADGTPLTLTLNDTEIEGQIEATVPPLGMEVWRTGRSGALLVGSLSAHSKRPLGGFVLFSGVVGAAGVGHSAASSGPFVIPVQRSVSSALNTGIALMNPGEGPLKVVLQLLNNEGAVLAESSDTLPRLGQTARFVSQFEWDPGVDLASFVGLLRVCPEGEVAAVALLSLPGQFATLPVAGVDLSDCSVQGALLESAPGR